MRRFTLLAAGLLLTAATATPATAQGSDSTKSKPAATGFAGNWRGSIQTPQGDQEVNCVIKKAGSDYTGSITGMQGDVALQDIKVEGDKLVASAVISIPDGSLQVWYTLVLKDDAISGKAEASFNGQAFAFDLAMRRVP